MGLNVAQLIEEHARARPTRPALHFGDRTLTYGALRDAAWRFGAGLRKLGLGPGDRVAILSANRPEVVVTYHAAHVAGLIPVLVNPLLALPEVTHVLADSGASAIVADHESFDLARSACRDAPDGVRLLATDAVNACEEPPLQDYAERRPDDTAVLIYTSGTTGRPKGVELTHFNVLWNAQAFALDLLRLTPDDVCCCALPLSHAYAHSCILGPFLYAGASIVLVPRFEPEAVFVTMARHGATVFMGVPTMFWALLASQPDPRLDLSRLRACVSGGQALPEEVHTRFVARFGVPISDGYGLTEATASVAGNRFGGVMKPRSAGPPYWGVTLRIVGDGGKHMPAGERGEIWVRGPNVMKGYFKNPDATAEVLVDGWLHTGDIGHVDADGYLFVVDRKKEMIIRGGYNVYPREVEEVLYAHPDVLEAAVVGAHDDRLGEEIVAYVVPKPGANPTISALCEHCRQGLASYKVPRRFELVTRLPKGPTGKIDKQAVRRWVAPAQEQP